MRQDLKTGSIEASLTCRGNSCQSLGAVTAEARSPLCFNLDLGTTKSLSADLSDVDGTHGCKTPERQVGASPLNDL